MQAVINPYRELPDHCFWSRAVTWPSPGHLDPMVGNVEILPEQNVSTMGSCFAQHLARHMQRIGLTYFVAERAPEGMTPEEAVARNYGVFSARYGNIYTMRQAVQLFDRAFGTFKPRDDVWPRGDGFVDAFRPQIEPEPFGSVSEVRQGAEAHLARVREVFEKSHWLVFTLGLTEAWRSRLDGAIYPVAPGVGGGSFDHEKYEFINLDFDLVQRDLDTFLAQVRRVNATCRVILTVSPVPLIATYEQHHVLVSTTYSKAVLRAVAGEVGRRHDNVVYFPSYEIITSPATSGLYYADDLRQVTDLGVKHVMRVFERHFLPGQQVERPEERQAALTELAGSTEVVCDEEMIEAALRASGVSAKEAIQRSSPAAALK